MVVAAESNKNNQEDKNKNEGEARTMKQEMEELPAFEAAVRDNGGLRRLVWRRGGSNNEVEG